MTLASRSALKLKFLLPHPAKSDAAWTYDGTTGYQFNQSATLTPTAARFWCERTPGARLLEFEDVVVDVARETKVVRFLVKRFQFRGDLPASGQLFLGIQLGHRTFHYQPFHYIVVLMAPV